MTRARTIIAWVAIGAACGSSHEKTGSDAGTDDAGGEADATADDSGGAVPEGCACFGALRDAMATTIIERAVPGMGIAVAFRGQLCGTAVMGVRENGSDAPLETSTLFGMASHSRIVTALAMARSAQLHELTDQDGIDRGLDSPVSAWVPELQVSNDQGYREPTLRELLSGRGGLEPRHDVDAPDCDTDPGSLAEYVARHPLAVWAAPGETWMKENDASAGDWNNFSIVGRALETAHQMPFGEAIRDLVPEMSTLTSSLDEAREQGLSTGHTGGAFGATPVDAATFDCAHDAPADRLYASIDDLGALAVILSAIDPADPAATEILGALRDGEVEPDGVGIRGNRQSMRVSYNPDGPKGPIGWTGASSPSGFVAAGDVRRTDGLVLLFVMNKSSNDASNAWVEQEYAICDVAGGQQLAFAPPRPERDWALYAGTYRALAPSQLIDPGEILELTIAVGPDGLTASSLGALDAIALDTFGTFGGEAQFVMGDEGVHSTWIEFPVLDEPPLRYCGEDGTSCP